MTDFFKLGKHRSLEAAAKETRLKKVMDDLDNQITAALANKDEYHKELIQKFDKLEKLRFDSENEKNAEEMMRIIFQDCKIKQD